MANVRILTWNIKASQRDDIIAYLTTRVDADILILSEYKVPAAGDRIRDPLARAGWSYQRASTVNPKKRGVLVASRFPLMSLGLAPDRARVTRALRGWVIYVSVPPLKIRVLGVYFPFRSGSERGCLWQAVIDAARRQRRGFLVIAGDFNSFGPDDTQSGPCYSPDELAMLSRFAVDAWSAAAKRRKTIGRYTFFTLGRGSRNDYIFLSPPLSSALVTARHRHSVREMGLSDHSAVEVQLAIGL